MECSNPILGQILTARNKLGVAQSDRENLQSVAQSGFRALALEARGRWFKSTRSDINKEVKDIDGRVVELVDALALEASGEIHTGSSPVTPTTF